MSDRHDDVLHQMWCKRRDLAFLCFGAVCTHLGQAARLAYPQAKPIERVTPMQLLIVEDQPSDLLVAAKAAEASGFAEINARASAALARNYLDKGLQGEQPLPDAIVLDLDLGYDSGFELLRFWHGNPRLARIPLVIWTVLGDHYQDICRMFKVNAYVYKGEDSTVLQQVLRGLSGIAA